MKTDLMAQSRYPWKIWLLLGLIIIAGITAVTLSAHWGIGSNPDSANYMGAARQLAAGNGFTTPAQDGPPIPYTLFGPFYPAILALASTLIGDPLRVAFVLNLLLLVINVLLSFSLLYTLTDHNPFPALVGVILIIAAPDILRTHTLALTESLFITFSLASWLFLARYLQREEGVWLVASALMTLLAFLTRYAAVSSIAAGLVGILLFSRQPLARRLIACVIYAIIAALPGLIWMSINTSAVGDTGGRAIAFHPITLSKLATGAFTFAKWVLPENYIRWITNGNWLPGLLSAGLIALMVVVVIVGIVHFFRAFGYSFSPKVIKTIHPLPAILIIYAVLHLLFLIFSISFLDAFTHLEERQLVTAHVAVLIAGVYLVYRLIRQLPHGSLIQNGVLLLCSLFIVSYVGQSVIQTVADYRDGVGFQAQQWRDSEAIAFLKTLPTDARIFTDNPEAVYLIVGRPAARIPFQYNFTTLRPNPNVEADIVNLGQQLEDGGYLVLFNDSDRQHLVSESELVQRFPLVEILSSGKERVYQAAS